MESQFGRWEQQEVAGHKIWLFEPLRLSTQRRAVIFLHGSDGMIPRERSEWERAFAERGLHVVAPVTGPTWWLNQIVPAFDPTWSPQDFVVQQVIPHVQQQWEWMSERLGILGVGMGGQGALALSYRFPRLFPAVAALAPEIDYHQLVPHEDEILTEIFGSREWARQHTAILAVHPLNWPAAQFVACDPTDIWYDSSDRLRMKLNSIGIPFTHDLETEAGGHTWDYFDALVGRATEFIQTGLRDAALRIVRS